jgi:uncharacterized phage protein (TIGR02218 family)
MKNLSAELATHIAGEVTTLATCWRLERTDGWVRGFTDHDLPLVIDGLTYVAATGFLPSAIKSGAGLSVDNLDVDGFLDDDALKAEDLAAGLFDGAKIDIFLVNWADLSQGRVLLRRGSLGEVKRADNRFSAEIRGIANRLQQIAGKLYSRLCRTDLGSAECKVVLAPLTDELAIGAVSSGDTFTVPTARPTGFYTFSVCTFLTGANAGAATEVLQHNGQSIQLFTPMPRPIVIGDQMRLVAGCDKTPETCHARFGNILNSAVSRTFRAPTRSSPIQSKADVHSGRPDRRSAQLARHTVASSGVAQRRRLRLHRLHARCRPAVRRRGHDPARLPGDMAPLSRRASHVSRLQGALRGD